MKKAIVSISLFYLILIGCSKNSSSNNNTSGGTGGSYSNWTLTTNNYDNGSYNSHPTNIVYSEAAFDTTSMSCEGFVDSSSTYNKQSTLYIAFKAKPTQSRVYKIGQDGGVSFTDSTCFMILSSLPSGDLYGSSSVGQSVNVTVNNGLITITFNDISLTGTDYYYTNTQHWPATISGTVYEGR